MDLVYVALPAPLAANVVQATNTPDGEIVFLGIGTRGFSELEWEEVEKKIDQSIERLRRDTLRNVYEWKIANRHLVPEHWEVEFAAESKISRRIEAEPANDGGVERGEADGAS